MPLADTKPCASSESGTLRENETECTDQSQRLQSEMLSLDPDGNEGNISDFNKDRIAEEAFRYLKERGLLDENAIEKHKDDFADHLGRTFPEIQKISELQRQFRQSTEIPEIRFKDSDLVLEDYLRRYFPRSIKSGLLLVSEIADEHLRRRISVEKARKGLSPQLADICLTYHDLLFSRREAIRTLAGISSQTEDGRKKLSSLGRSLIDRHTTRNRHSAASPKPL